MTPRVREILDYLEQNPSVSIFAAFSPPRRDSVRQFVGGGVVTAEEFRAVMAAWSPRCAARPLTEGQHRSIIEADAAAEGRKRRR